MRIETFANNPLTKSMRITSARNLLRTKRIFSVSNSSGQKIGTFQFAPDGFVSDLDIKKKFRRKKEGVSALFAIKKFVTKMARKNHLDCVKFDADDKNPNQVVKLYKRFATEVDDRSNSVFMMPVNSRGRKFIKDCQQYFSLAF